MISSLTGFGRATFTDEAGRIGVELKSVNNRFLQIDLHLPYGYNWADGLIRQQLSNRISRGKIYLHLEVVDYNPNQEVIINRPLLKKLINLNEEVSKETGRSLPIEFDGLLSLPGVMKVDSKQADNDETWKRIQPVLNEAVENFAAARVREGQNLAEDMRQRSSLLEDAISKIETLLPEFKQQFITKFTERINELAGKAGFDESRLATEIALWADRSDVSEEITRLRSHLKELENILVSDKPSGRRLDFLVQELNREANTLSSKISDVTITQLALDIKCEIEKIREQAQNIE
ncbi:MAG: YicC family protein [Erysipelotrichia bacterium]|nr:YicC family protein [Erysipelotrichia bacterium]